VLVEQHLQVLVIKVQTLNLVRLSMVQLALLAVALVEAKMQQILVALEVLEVEVHIREVAAVPQPLDKEMLVEQAKEGMALAVEGEGQALLAQTREVLALLAMAVLALQAVLAAHLLFMLAAVAVVEMLVLVELAVMVAVEQDKRHLTGQELLERQILVGVAVAVQAHQIRALEAPALLSSS
jgi:hypothetical protein